jgi:DNA-binding transcriptional LysR family regulator
MGPAGGEVEVRVEPVLRAGNVEALRHAALTGLGIALLATFVAGKDLAAGGLVPLLPGWRPAESAVFLVYPNAPFVPRKVRALADFLAERFHGVPPWERGSAGNRP